MLDGVLAPHPPENLVIAGLDREVQGRADGGRAGHRVDEAVGEIPGVRGDEPQAGNRGPSVGTAQGADRLDQLGQVGPRRPVDSLPCPPCLGHVGEAALRGQVVPVAVDVLAEERDLAVARGGERSRFRDHFVERPAPLGPAAERHDAVRAGLVAAVDDRQPRGDRRLAAHRARRDGVRARPGEVIGGRYRDALDQRGRGRPRRHGRTASGRWRARGTQADRALDGRQAEPLHQLRLLVGAQEQVHRREPAPQTGPVALAHGTTGQDHAEGRVRGLERGERALPADDLRLGRLADRARVDDHEVGRLDPRGLGAARTQEPAGHLLRIASVHLATQRPDPEAREGLVLGPELGDAGICRRGRRTRPAGRQPGRDEIQDGKLAGRHGAIPAPRAAMTPVAIREGTQVSAIASAYVSPSPW